MSSGAEEVVLFWYLCISRWLVHVVWIIFFGMKAWFGSPLIWVSCFYYAYDKYAILDDPQKNCIKLKIIKITLFSPFLLISLHHPPFSFWIKKKPPSPPPQQRLWQRLWCWMLCRMYLSYSTEWSDLKLDFFYVSAVFSSFLVF